MLAGIIGLERSTWNKPAGFRTHILVAVGSALVMLTSANVIFRIPLNTGFPIAYAVATLLCVIISLVMCSYFGSSIISFIIKYKNYFLFIFC